MIGKNEEWHGTVDTTRWDAMRNAHNPNQGNARKVLCVCSAGLLRSPTIAWVLSNPPWSFNTRAAGIGSYALIPVSQVLLHWADQIVVADYRMVAIIEQMLKDYKLKGKQIVSFDIPDHYARMEPILITFAEEQAEKLLTR